jgi:hypothetical protein
LKCTLILGQRELEFAGRKDIGAQAGEASRHPSRVKFFRPRESFESRAGVVIIARQKKPASPAGFLSRIRPPHPAVASAR